MAAGLRQRSKGEKTDAREVGLKKRIAGGGEDFAIAAAPRMRLTLRKRRRRAHKLAAAIRDTAERRGRDGHGDGVRRRDSHAEEQQRDECRHGARSVQRLRRRRKRQRKWRAKCARARARWRERKDTQGGSPPAKLPPKRPPWRFAIQQGCAATGRRGRRPAPAPAQSRRTSSAESAAAKRETAFGRPL